MFEALGLALMVAQTAAPAPAPEWLAADPMPGEYRRMVRHVEDAPDEALLGKIQFCDCQPGPLLDTLTATLSKLPHATIKRGPAPACGTVAQHLVVTGIADEGTRKNFDLYAFRVHAALATIMYTFTKAAPTPGDEAAMLALCPADADEPTK